MPSTVPDTLTRVRITSVKTVAPDVYTIEFKRFFEFEAGQIIKLAWEEEAEPRLYSIASGEKDTHIEVLFNVIGDGYLTPLMSLLKPGDEIFASRAFGRYTGTMSPAWWIAAGTGIAPFISMLRSGQGGQKTLVHGGRFAYSFYYSDEFLSALGPDYIRCCSKETGEGLFHGRITEYLRQVPVLPEETLYYLCGGAEMVVETRELLLARGIPFTKIVSEIYF